MSCSNLWRAIISYFYTLHTVSLVKIFLKNPILFVQNDEWHKSDCLLSRRGSRWLHEIRVSYEVGNMANGWVEFDKFWKSLMCLRKTKKVATYTWSHLIQVYWRCHCSFSAYSPICVQHEFLLLARCDRKVLTGISLWRRSQIPWFSPAPFLCLLCRDLPNSRNGGSFREWGIKINVICYR
jgi:hypothetical protein